MFISEKAFFFSQREVDPKNAVKWRATGRNEAADKFYIDQTTGQDGLFVHLYISVI